MWPHLVIVSTPSLAFSNRIVEAHEPVLVQAFSAELAVDAFDECVVGRRTGPREVQHDALHVRPQVEISGDELAALIDPDRGRVANLPTDAVQNFDHVRRPEAEPRHHRQRNRL